MIRLHCIEHVPFESPGRIAEWAAARGHSFTTTRVYAGDSFPELDSFDALVVMGGPMGVHDDARFAWLVDEKRAIEEALHAQKRILGVCLGAQLVAHVLGARVYRNRFREIGWFPIHATPAGHEQWNLPKEFIAFHWHGDAFDLPRDAVHLAKSAACEQQMYAIGQSVLGIQFHLEATRAGVEDFVRHGAAELGEGPYIQTPDAMTASQSHVAHVAPAHELMDALLDRWSA